MTRQPTPGFFVALLAMALLAAPTLVRGQTVERLEVEHDHVTAADLARVMPEWSELPGLTAILYAPLPGLSRELFPADLERLAVRNGLDPAKIARWPAQLEIRRRMRRLERTEAEAALVTALAVRYRISPEDVGIDLVQFRAFEAPAGPLQFRAGEAFRPPGEVATVPLTWVTPEGRSGTLWLRARLSVLGRYAVAARAIEPRTPIAPDDVTVAEGVLEVAPDRWVLDPRAAVGKTLARRVAAGEKIPRGWLITPHVLERGALVELRVSSGGIEVRAPGRAEQPGALGERVMVRNLSSGRQVAARISGAHRAEVVAAPFPLGGEAAEAVPAGLREPGAGIGIGKGGLGK